MMLSFKDSRNGLIEVTPGTTRESSPEDVLPSKLVTSILDSLEEPDFQRYALTELNNKRGDNPSLSFSLNFKKGYLDPARSFIEA